MFLLDALIDVILALLVLIYCQLAFITWIYEPYQNPLLGRLIARFGSKYGFTLFQIVMLSIILMVRVSPELAGIFGMSGMFMTRFSDTPSVNRS